MITIIFYDYYFYRSILQLNFTVKVCNYFKNLDCDKSHEFLIGIKKGRAECTRVL